MLIGSPKVSLKKENKKMMKKKITKLNSMKIVSLSEKVLHLQFQDLLKNTMMKYSQS